MNIKMVNTILYCHHWEDTVAFYRDTLGLAISFSKRWFVEFILTEGARVSIADERYATISSSNGRGVTLSIEVYSIDESHRQISQKGLSPSPITDHPWNARVFFIHDPEGNRIEFWMACPPRPDIIS